MTKTELRERIKRDLGYPYVKVELTEDHLNDAIDDTVHKWLEWTIGNSVEEYFFTIPLSAGQSEYILPDYITDVIAYNGSDYDDGINTLFTIENYFYSTGALNPHYFLNNGGLIEYQIALNFLETLDQFTVDKFTYNYDRKNRILKLTPTPEMVSVKTIDDEEWNFGGFILIKGYAYSGSFTSTWNEDSFLNNLYSENWVIKYAKALCKVTLGMIRRKYSGNTPIGNVGIQLDGAELVSEGNTEMEQLKEELDLEYAYDGYGIMIG